MINRVRIFVLSAMCFAWALEGQNAAGFDALAKRADAARDAGKTDEAVALYQKALHLKPDWRQGWWALGSMLYDANRYQEGEQAFLPLTKLDPDKSPGWAMAGLCEFEIEHYQDSLQNLQLANKIGLPRSLFDVSLYHVLLIMIRTGEFDPAIKMISGYAARGNDNPRLVEAMGIAALRMPVLPRDVPVADHDLVMALGRAMCDAAENRGREAIAEFDAILASHPNSPEVHYLDGMVLLQSDPDKAIDAFNQELILFPSNVRTLVSLAAEYVTRNDYKTARTFAERAVTSDPKYFATHAVLGKVLVEGDLDLVLGSKELEKAVALDPDNPQSRVALAEAYSKMGRKEDAAKQRREFLRLRTAMDANSPTELK